MRIQFNSDLKQYLLRLVEVVILFLSVLVVLWLSSKILTYVLPFALGLIIAVLLFPIVRYLEKWGLSRRLAIVMTFIIVLMIIFGLIGYLTVQGTQEAISLSQAIPNTYVHFSAWVTNWLERGMIVYGHLSPKIVSAIQSSVFAMVDQVRQILLNLVSSLVIGLEGLPNMLIIVVISLLASYFYMAQKESLTDGIVRLLPPGWGPKLGSVATDVLRAFVGLTRAQVILIMVSTVISIIGLLVIDPRYALILGLLIGLTGWFPVVGSGIITIPWIIGAYTAKHFGIAIEVAVLQIIVSVVRHSIEPKLMASNMELGTLSALFGMYVGLTTIGVIGLVIGPLLMIALRSLIKARMFVDLVSVERKMISQDEDPLP